ncbi:MAG TPA: hypothetical protein VKB50_01530 [Vicinamibacterales bacterium]|nr:hypothetical protein [Vicinamibacterales bacterium]
MEPPSPDLPGNSTLSIHRAFVVRLYAGIDPASGCIGGQVEHVLSGDGGEFKSIEELLQLMHRALDKGQRPSNCHAEEQR